MSKITVTTIAGQTSGSDANKVKIESGDTLEVTSNATVGGTLGVTGDATFDTNTLKVDSSNNRVGIGTASPSYTLHSSTSTGSDYAGFFHNGAGSGNGTALVAKGGANNSGAGTFIVQDYGGNEDFKVDGLGRVTMPSQPTFSVRGDGSGEQNMTASDYIAFRNVQTVHTNIGNHFDSSTGRFTAPIAGNYLIGFAMRYDGMGSSYFYVSIYKNGNTYMSRQLSTVTGSYLHATTTAIVPMAASDYVSVHCRSNSDTSVSLDGDSNFYGVLLG